MLDVAGLAAVGDGALDRGRRAGLQHLQDDARRGRTDVRNLPQRAVGLQQRLDRFFERQDRAGGALVAPHALLRLLDRGEVAQQRRDLAVQVHARAGARHQLILSIVCPDTFVANPRPAATVVVLRDSSGRAGGASGPPSRGQSFMGGAHVFPGGRVDASDHDGSPEWCDGVDGATAAAGGSGAAGRDRLSRRGGPRAVRGGRRAARARRRPAASSRSRAPTYHERFKRYRKDVHAGSRDACAPSSKREHLRLALDSLVLFAHWVTPPIDTRQFDTRFFMSRVPPDQTPAHDEAETTRQRAG